MTYVHFALVATFVLFLSLARRAWGGALWFPWLTRVPANAITFVGSAVFGLLLTGSFTEALAIGLTVLAWWSPGHGLLYDFGDNADDSTKSTMDKFISVALVDVFPNISLALHDFVGMLIRYGAYGVVVAGIMNIPAWFGLAPYRLMPYLAFGVGGVIITFAYKAFHDLRHANKLWLPANSILRLNEYYCYGEYVLGAVTAWAVMSGLGL